MSVARSNATATPLSDGRVLVAGGYDRRVTQLPNPTGQPLCCLDIQILPLASTELFNPTSAAWEPAAPLAHGRSGHESVALKDGRVLVVGGADRQNPERLIDSAESYDPVARHGWLLAASALQGGNSLSLLSPMVALFWQEVSPGTDRRS